MVIPVVQSLSVLPGTTCVVLALTTAARDFAEAGIAHQGFASLVGAGDEPALRKGRELAAAMSGQSAFIPADETAAYLGLSFVDLVQRIGERDAQLSFERLGRQAFLPLSILIRAINKYDPDVVVATNSPRAERAAIEVAGQLGLPSVCINDLFAIGEIGWLGRPGYATRVCVLSQIVKDRLVAFGRDPGEIVVTGNPAFDSLLRDDVRSKGYEYRAALGDCKRVILWASQPEPNIHPFTHEPGNPELPGQILSSLINFAARDRECVLLVRPHPSENASFDCQLSNVVFARREIPISQLVHAADVCVTMTSTVALEAAIAGKPVVCVSGSVFEKDVMFVEMGIALRASVADLEETVVRAISTRLIRPVGEDGKAAKRVAEVILSVAG